MLWRQGMGCQCPGETLSSRLSGKDAQSWQHNPACLHASFATPACLGDHTISLLLLVHTGPGSQVAFSRSLP